MLLAVTDLLWLAAVLVLYVVGSVAAIALAIGLPALVGKLVHDRARTEDLANPVVLGFGAGFFAMLVGAFVVGMGLVYLG